MRHYGINDKEINKKLYLDKKLCGLVENYFDDMTLDEYEKELNRNIRIVSDKLSSIFDDLERPIIKENIN